MFKNAFQNLIQIQSSINIVCDCVCIATIMCLNKYYKSTHFTREAPKTNINTGIALPEGLTCFSSSKMLKENRQEKKSILILYTLLLKNPQYMKHWISGPMRKVSPLPWRDKRLNGGFFFQYFFLMGFDIFVGSPPKKKKVR